MVSELYGDHEHFAFRIGINYARGAFFHDFSLLLIKRGVHALVYDELLSN